MTVYVRGGSHAQQIAAHDLQKRIDAANRLAERTEMLTLQATERIAHHRAVMARNAAARAEAEAYEVEHAEQTHAAHMAEAEATRQWCVTKWPESVRLGKQRLKAAAADKSELIASRLAAAGLPANGHRIVSNGPRMAG